MILAFSRRVQSEDDEDDFTPVGAFGVGIKEPEIGHEVPLVVGVNARCFGWVIVEGWRGHVGLPQGLAVGFYHKFLTAPRKRCANSAHHADAREASRMAPGVTTGAAGWD
jgi:hypothetical protein